MLLATLKLLSDLLVKLERGAIALRSVQFVRSVKVLTVRKEGFTVRKLHVISDTYNISALLFKLERGAISLRSV